MMTDVAKIRAGPILDSLIAEHVMDCKVTEHKRTTWVDKETYYSPDGGLHEVDPYSTDIAFAWEVFEKIFELNKHAKWIRAMRWEGLDPELPYGCQYGEGLEVVWGETMPLAICKAALIAWEKKNG